MYGLGFRVYGLGFEVWVQESRFIIHVQELGFMVQGSGSEFQGHVFIV